MLLRLFMGDPPHIYHFTTAAGRIANDGPARFLDRKIPAQDIMELPA